MRKQEIVSGYILTKGKEQFITEDDKWGAFTNKTKHFHTLAEAKEWAQSRRSAKIVEVIFEYTYDADNRMTEFNRIERKIK